MKKPKPVISEQDCEMVISYISAENNKGFGYNPPRWGHGFRYAIINRLKADGKVEYREVTGDDENGYWITSQLNKKG